MPIGVYFRTKKHMKNWFKKGHKHSGRPKGFKLTEEHKRKLSEAHKGKPSWKKGKKTGLIPWNKGTKGLQKSWNKGKKLPQFSRKNAHNWKGGRGKTTQGYIWINKPNYPSADKQGRILEHRYIMEQHLGRFLKQKEELHHLDGNKTNNNIKNLKLFRNKSEHMKIHKNHR